MKKKTLRVIGILCLLCILTASLIAYRLYNKPHPSAASATAVVLTASQLASEYEKDETGSNKKYLGKALQVSGTVSEVSENQQQKTVIFLTASDMSGIQCSLEAPATGVKKGDAVTIKGFCTGFLTDVILDRCVLTY